MTTDPASQAQAREEKLAKLKEEQIEDLAKALAAKLGLPYINLDGTPVDFEALKIVSEARARLAGLLVFAKTPKDISAAVLDPSRPETKTLMQELEKFGRVILYLSSERSFSKFLEAYRMIPKEREKITGEQIVGEKAFSLFRGERLAFQDIGEILKGIGETQAGELAQHIFASAASFEASDIHIEPSETGAALRYRIDGVLYRIADLSPEAASRLTNRIKLLAELKLNITQAPQDGRFTISTPRELIEVRVSTVPDPNGENVAMRLLLPRAIMVKLEDLGLRDDDAQIINQEIKRPNGLLIVTGPTGAGKTTTLYACLRKIASPAIKIITIEDPIEYRIEGVEQTQVEPEKGYAFDTGLKSILRQDPDVILVGEIRDHETAEIAMHAALTGHLVFTTLHTNDAAGTVPRLIDLGVEPKIIPAAITLVVAQRVMRRICEACSREVTLSEELAKKMSRHLEDLPSRVTRVPKIKAGIAVKIAGKGCADCFGTGYRGRVGVFELIQMTEELETLIHGSPSESDIRKRAVKSGMVTMLQDAILKVMDGITDTNEVERVIGPL